MINSENLDVFNFVGKMSTQVQETQDEFIFSTINDFLHEQTNMVIKKDELIKAVSLLRMVEEHGPGIYQCWGTDSEQSYMLHNSYMRGFQDGVKKEHDRVMSILERKENQNE